MEHNQLLEILKDNPIALAVAKLHTPDDEGDCFPCRPDLAYRSYPCLTIQAIQGQLSTEIIPADEA